MRKELAVALAILALAVVALALAPKRGEPEGFERSLVIEVVDGDTFWCYAGGSEFKVRLADVDAPELGTAEGEVAKAFLRELLEGEEVLLDVDDLYRTDRYGRIVAVAYLPLNSTHCLNVDALLVEEGYARSVDYPNEFSPREWCVVCECLG